MMETRRETLDFFVGSGTTAQQMRALDWTKTPLGSPEHWSQSLRTAIRIMLTSRYAMWMAWGDGLTFFYNDAYSPTLGVKQSWAMGSAAQEVWAEIWADIRPRIEKVLQTGEATWDEGLMLFLERSGYPEETYHTFSYSPLADENGAVSGMLCVVTEETQRIIGERRLALLRDVASALASVQTTDAVFAAIEECITRTPQDLPFTLTYLFDNDGDTAQLVSRTGISAEHPFARPTLTLKSEDTSLPLEELLTSRQPILLEHLGEQFPALPSGAWGKSPTQAVAVPIAQQGQERPAGFMIAAINPYRQYDADYAGFISLLAGQIASSLANARAYEEEKRRAAALAELDRAKTTFFSNVSHEFRTPLTLMLGPMEDALANESQTLQGEPLQIVHRNGLRLLKLVNTLLDFARIESGRVQANYAPVDLAEMTLDLASTFRSAIEKAGMQFHVDCPPLSEPVYVDGDMWEKIVLNLLSNAFKFTLDGEIEIRLREHHRHAILTVRDTGTGITEEQLPHIFERFHRIEGTPARTHEGTGIGLALVQELVRLHGGTVSVASVYGEGTTFTVELPLGKAHLPQDRISAPVTLAPTSLRAETFVEEALHWLPDTEQSLAERLLPPLVSPPKKFPADAARKRIVLADDNADMRSYVRSLLETHYDVTVAANGEEALDAIHATKPDLILSDIMMPKLDGFGLLQAVRSDPYTASVPVLLLSARAGEEARIEGLIAGADDYLTKPFSARELMARVASHLELARVRGEAEQAIRESEERFRVALSNVPLTVFTCDRDLRYTWIANPPDGQKVEDIIGKRDDELIPPEDAAQFITFKQQVLETGRGARKEMVHVAPNRTSYFDMTAEPLKNGEGEIIGLTAAAFDITSLKQYEQNLAAMNAQLQRAMTETHHRVKNNLQLISALIDMRREGGEKMVPIEDLSRLGANVNALGVIHDILTQEAKAGNTQETLSVKEVLERLLIVLQQTVGGRRLTSDLDDVRVAGRQATTLALVTNELVLNALKHGKGEIGIRFRVKGTGASLEVLDDGSGFPANFDPTVAANTGLELIENIVKWDLRGTTSYTNRPEGGARIVVNFTPMEKE